MNTEQLKPIQIETIDSRREQDYLLALQYPLETLQHAVREKSTKDIPLVVSHDRGSMPILSYDANIDTAPIAVVANTGALSFNSPAFVQEDRDPELAKIIAYDKVAYGPRMLGYSTPKDGFAFETVDADKSLTVLFKIADSYKTIGIEVSRHLYPVPSLNDWVNSQKGNVPILANAYDPLLLANFGRSFQERQAFFQRGLVHAAAYTKDGINEYWEAAGVPVPPTYYYNVENGNQAVVSGSIVQTLQESGYERAVISTPDGAGGDGVVFFDLPQIADGLVGRLGKGKIQVQGLLPLEASPCLIANISPDDISLLLLSDQRFASPGSHGGNVWEDEDKILQRLPEDFMEVNMKALEALQKAKIHGQVNIDALVISQDAAEKFDLPATTLMREANIRPAGSSVILRMKQGNVDGRRVSRVHTSSVKIPYEVVQTTQFLDDLNQFSEEGVKVVLYSYDIHADKASLAVIGGEGIARDIIQKVENDTVAFFKEKLTK